jgi:hypothetical protein
MRFQDHLDKTAAADSDKREKETQSKQTFPEET